MSRSTKRTLRFSNDTIREFLFIMNARLLSHYRGLSLLLGLTLLAPDQTVASILPILPLLTAAQDASSSPAGLSFPHQERARELGERLYNSWRLSMSRRDEVAWRKVTPRSRQQRVLNLVRSMNGTLSHDFFGEEAKQLPMLEQFRYIGAIAGANRRTMNLVYLGRLQVAEGKSQPVAYVLYLVDESGRGGWTFDKSRFISLEHTPKYTTRLSKRDLSLLREVELFHPYKALPPVTASVGTPQLIAKVFADTPGRVVDIKINGVSTHEFYNERRADVILGGLKKGENTVSYTIANVDGAPRNTFAIGLFVMPTRAGQKPAVVFEHILDSKMKAQGGSFTFHIGNSLLATMNPEYKGPRAAPFRPVPLKKKK